MGVIARRLSAEDYRAVAAWYAALPPPEPNLGDQPDPDLLALGERIYHRGLPAPATPVGRPDRAQAVRDEAWKQAKRVHPRPDAAVGPCARCHGAAGQGLGPAVPPLWGQPAAYLEAQLERWRLGKRQNSPGHVMLAISWRLQPRERAAVAAYAARLPGPVAGAFLREAPAAVIPAPSPPEHHRDQ